MTDNFSTPARGARPGRRRTWALVALLAIAMVAALIAVMGGLSASGSRRADAATPRPVEIRTEAADVVGDAPFVDPTQAGPVVLDGPASPGTGDLGACDPDRLISYLQTHDAAAAAWVHALDVDPTLHWSGGSQVTVDQIPDYVHRLTAVKLDRDTRVTNYFFRDGTAVPFQSVLVDGTAVLVDADGTPRVRCACGNPLNPPVIVTPPVPTPCDRTNTCPNPPCVWDRDQNCPQPCDTRDDCPQPCNWDRDHKCPQPCDKRDVQVDCPPPCDQREVQVDCPPPCDKREVQVNCPPPCDKREVQVNCPPPCDKREAQVNCPPPCEQTQHGCPPNPVCPDNGCKPTPGGVLPVPVPNDPPATTTDTGPQIGGSSDGKSDGHRIETGGTGRHHGGLTDSGGNPSAGSGRHSGNSGSSDLGSRTGREFHPTHEFTGQSHEFTGQSHDFGSAGLAARPDHTRSGGMAGGRF